MSGRATGRHTPRPGFVIPSYTETTKKPAKTKREGKGGDTVNGGVGGGKGCGPCTPTCSRDTSTHTHTQTDTLGNADVRHRDEMCALLTRRWPSEKSHAGLCRV